MTAVAELGQARGVIKEIRNRVSLDEEMVDFFYGGFLKLTAVCPELAHILVMKVAGILEKNPGVLKAIAKRFETDTRGLEVEAPSLGLTFSSRDGVCSGVTKDAIGAGLLAALNPAHLEVGTITGEPWKGNPFFSREKDGKISLGRMRRFWKNGQNGKELAIVNRMGLPGPGAEKVMKNLEAIKRRLTAAGIDTPIAISIGPTPGRKTPEEIVADLGKTFACLAKSSFRPVWITVNNSCPNVEHEGDDGDFFVAEQAALLAKEYKIDAPLVFKFTPDMSEAKVEKMTKLLISLDYWGVLLSNTTSNREGERAAFAGYKGGLSGYPVFEMTLDRVKLVRRLDPEGRLKIIACGGINSAEKVELIQKAGAFLVQGATYLVQEGPFASKKLKRKLIQLKAREGVIYENAAAA